MADNSLERRVARLRVKAEREKLKKPRLDRSKLVPGEYRDLCFALSRKVGAEEALELVRAQQVHDGRPLDVA